MITPENRLERHAGRSHLHQVNSTSKAETTKARMRLISVFEEALEPQKLIKSKISQVRKGACPRCCAEDMFIAPKL